MVNKDKKRNLMCLSVVLAIVLVGIVIANTIEMRYVLLDSAQVMGREISRRLATEEMQVLSRFFYLLDYLEIELRTENRKQDLAAWMQSYLKPLDGVPTLSEMDIYVAIQGKVISATYWENETSYNPYGTQWYQKAVEARGATIVTDSYMDSRLNRPVITMAKKIMGTEDVVAIDLYFSDVSSSRSSVTLPEGSNYYMCDSKGKLLYGILDSYPPESNLYERFPSMVQQLEQGKYESSLSYTYGQDKEKRAVYYYKMENGWYSIITIPYRTLLKETNRIWIPFFIILMAFFASLVVYGWYTFQDRKKLRLYNSTLAVLGNSYYGLYQIDLNTQQYEILKSSDYIRSQIPTQGEYREFLQALQYVIEPEAYPEFKKAFSIDNMKELTAKRVRDFGGDFKRIFNQKLSWTHIHMLYDESLQNGKVVLCFRDVNSSKEEELARMDLLQHSLDGLNSMAQAKNRFFSRMSHDMRTPLNAIIGLCTLALNQQQLTEKTKDSFQKILSSSRQLLGLINDILEMSKMEHDGVQIHHQPFDLKANLQEMCEILEVQAFNEQKNFHFQFEIIHTNVCGDWRRIQQILNNVLSNSFKYSPIQSTISFTVTEFVDPNSKYHNYQFVVEDNGSGMSEEFLKKLFDPFQREMRFGVEEVNGTGLGMAITKDLVTHMDGQIEVDSHLGEGTTMVITLPMEVLESEASTLEEESITPTKTSCTEGCRVLLAEDNAINMEITTELLQMHHLEVVQAWNGKEALDIFAASEEGWFDLILLDMQMPVMDGCSAAKAIRNLHRADAKTVPIIAVTANAFSEDIAQTHQAGMNAHIAKPIDFAVFEKTLRQLLQ